jgi:hypothetical protein
MKRSRRSALAGISALAFGSGVTSTIAAFNSAISGAADMRVVVADGLEVRAGQAFNDDGSINTANGNITPSNYVEYATNSTFFDLSSDPEPQGLVDIDSDDLPVATVNRRDENVNEDVKIQVATSIDTTSVTFHDILEIKNNGTSPVNVGISYDRNTQTDSVTDTTANPDSSFNQYGDDVNVAGNTGTEITDATVQHIYQFTVPDPNSNQPNIISPSLNSTGDEPTEVQTIGPGGKIQLSLSVDISDIVTVLGNVDVQSQIEDAATLSGSPFQEKRDTVDLLDGITVGIEDANNQF